VARRSTCAWTATAAVVLFAAVSSAGEPTPFRIRIPPSHHADWVRAAVERAHARLASPECQKLFTDFADQAGRPLQQKLDTLGLTGQQFLGFVGFYDGYSQTQCRRDYVVAFTQPGSLAVHVCPQIVDLHREMAEVIVLHEMLHSLGLGERPPSSLQITQQVERRCGGRDEAVSARSARR
jgi:hypothetical protein